MTARKTTRKRTACEKSTPVVRSATGAELIDGRPFFATFNGERMHRAQWLAATADDRKAALVAELNRAAEEGETSGAE